jgi:hypothetical protein
MYSTKKTIFIFMGILVFFGILLSLPTGNAITRERYISTIAEKDTYVDTANPTSNYGGVNYLMTGFGIFSDIREAYFYFDFSDKPQNYIRAEISLDFWGVSQTMNYTICLIEESWNENSMTWINKPEKGEVIDNILVTSDTIYTIDVTSLISGRTNISICVYIEVDNYVDDYAYITSKEGYYLDEDAPQLKWIYTETAEITVTSPSSSSGWQEGGTYTISWSSVGSISEVTIELFKASTQIEEITFISTENDGSYSFYVSSLGDYEEGDDYRIKITDYDDENVYDFSEYFSLTARSLPSIPGFGLEIFISIITVSMIYLVRKVRISSFKDNANKHNSP